MRSYLRSNKAYRSAMYLETEVCGGVPRRLHASNHRRQSSSSFGSGAPPTGPRPPALVSSHYSGGGKRDKAPWQAARLRMRPAAVKVGRCGDDWSMSARGRATGYGERSVVHQSTRPIRLQGLRKGKTDSSSHATAGQRSQCGE